MIENIGIIGAVLLAICALPQAVVSILTGNSYGLSYAFLFCWFVGDLCLLAYTSLTIGPQGPLFYNYLFNALLLCVICYYRLFPRR